MADPAHLLTLADIDLASIQELVDFPDLRPDDQLAVDEEETGTASFWVALLVWPLSAEGQTGGLLTEKDKMVLGQFEEAARQLGVHAVHATPDPTESVQDVIRSASALLKSSMPNSTGCLVVRNAQRAAQEIARLDIVRAAKIAVLNGGGPFDEGPVGALEYLAVIRREFGEISGLRIAIVGDLNSDLSRSLVIALSLLGADVQQLTERDLVELTQTGSGARASSSLFNPVDAFIVVAIQPGTGSFLQSLARQRHKIKPLFLFTAPASQPPSLADTCDQFRVVSPTRADAVLMRKAAIRYCLTHS